MEGLGLGWQALYPMYAWENNILTMQSIPTDQTQSQQGVQNDPLLDTI